MMELDHELKDAAKSLQKYDMCHHVVSVDTMG